MVFLSHTMILNLISFHKQLTVDAAQTGSASADVSESITLRLTLVIVLIPAYFVLWNNPAEMSGEEMMKEWTHSTHHSLHVDTCMCEYTHACVSTHVH